MPGRLRCFSLTVESGQSFAQHELHDEHCSDPKTKSEKRLWLIARKNWEDSDRITETRGSIKSYEKPRCHEHGDFIWTPPQEGGFLKRMRQR